MLLLGARVVPAEQTASGMSKAAAAGPGCAGTFPSCGGTHLDSQQQSHWPILAGPDINSCVKQRAGVLLYRRFALPVPLVLPNTAPSPQALGPLLGRHLDIMEHHGDLTIQGMWGPRWGGAQVGLSPGWPYPAPAPGTAPLQLQCPPMESHGTCSRGLGTHGTREPQVYPAHGRLRQSKSIKCLCLFFIPRFHGASSSGVPLRLSLGLLLL